MRKPPYYGKPPEDCLDDYLGVPRNLEILADPIDDEEEDYYEGFYDPDIEFFESISQKLGPCGIGCIRRIDFWIRWLYNLLRSGEVNISFETTTGRYHSGEELYFTYLGDNNEEGL